MPERRRGVPHGPAHAEEHTSENPSEQGDTDDQPLVLRIILHQCVIQRVETAHQTEQTLPDLVLKSVDKNHDRTDECSDATPYIDPPLVAISPQKEVMSGVIEQQTYSP